MLAVIKHCARKKKLQRKMTKDCYGKVLEKILACSVIREMIVIALFTCHCLKDKLGLSSINCHIHAIIGTNSLRVVSAITRNPR